MGTAGWLTHGRDRLVCFVIRVVGVCLVILFAQLGGGAYVANAASGGDGCNPGRTDDFLHYYYDGSYEYVPGGDNSGGVVASILNYSPWVYAEPSSMGGPDASSQWVMLTNSGASRYAQVGWTEQQYGVRNTFVEWGTVGGAFHDWYGSPYSVNSMIPYKVLFRPDLSNNFWFYANDTELTSVDFEYLTNPSQAQLYAEIWTKASQMPGGSNNKDFLRDGQLWYPAGTSGSWHTLNATIDTPPGFAEITPTPGTTADYYNIWDDACTN